MTMINPTTRTWTAELTDTYGGEANYSWVSRETFSLPAGAGDRTIIRAGKAAAGLTGIRCRTENYGDSFTLRPFGQFVVLFITPEAS